MSESIPETLAALIARLDGRAAGVWVGNGDTLRLVAFQPSPDLPDSVRVGFTDATRTVPLSLPELAIVRACLEREPVLSIAESLPPDRGSGYWLRAFGAACSLAVPIVGSDPATTGVLSVAMRAVPTTPDKVAALLRTTGVALLDHSRREDSD